ncbi:MAG: TetR/AcrR family transcriptional regulator [Myxococcota bacterium]|nr:TetR/AcrR family transcriptional regulator [Myxococcota bacterium]
MPRQKDQETAKGRQRHEEKYQRILNGAMAVFAEKGFTESRVSEIAERAGVGDGTIYLYFKNKDDLLISLFEAKLEEINAGLSQQITEQMNPKLQLQTVIEYHLNLALENPHLAALVTLELRRSGKFMKEYAKEQFFEYLQQWTLVIENGKEVGFFRKDFSTGILRNILFGALDYVTGIWVSNPKRKASDLHEVAKQLEELILRAISAES